MENRRDFLKHISLLAAAMPFIVNCKSAAVDDSSDILSLIKKNAITDPNSNWTGAKDVPANVTWKSILAKESDKGERMLITGTVFQADDKTPAPNTLIYLYHTDIEGFYGRKGEPQHGRYRGWMLTNDKGNYEFQTIKPAPYPENKSAAHIHFTLTGINLKEDWIDNILFEGDELISQREREMSGKKGGFNPILKLEKGANGIWRGRRDIQLWQA